LAADRPSKEQVAYLKRIASGEHLPLPLGALRMVLEDYERLLRANAPS